MIWLVDGVQVATARIAATSGLLAGWLGPVRVYLHYSA